jgi:DNA-binding SARP family transcriptional activator
MKELKIHLLGGVEVFRGDAPLPAFPTQKSLSLFAYLVLARGRLVHRDTVCGHFWGDQTDVEARKALRTCLWRIRSVIEPDPEDRGTLLQVEGSQIRFAKSRGTWVDAWEMEDALGAPPPELPDGERVGLERAVALYSGDFLEGLHDDWCFLHRERLRLAHLTALERLVALHRSRARWLDVIACGSRILRSDPLREHVHRALMESHLAMGDRPSALRQYERCCRTLREELDIAPMDETRRLAVQIRNGDHAGPPDPLGPDGLDSGLDPDPLLADVRDAIAALQGIADRLERARGPVSAESAGHPPLAASRGGRLRSELEAPGA